MHITKSLGQIRNHNTVIKKEKKRSQPEGTEQRREQTQPHRTLSCRREHEDTEHGPIRTENWSPPQLLQMQRAKEARICLTKTFGGSPSLEGRAGGCSKRNHTGVTLRCPPEKQLVAALGTTQCGRRREPDGRGQGTDLTGTGCTRSVDNGPGRIHNVLPRHPVAEA